MDLPTEHANACGNHWEQKTTNKFVPTCGADKHESNFNCTPKVAPSKKLLELRTPYILIDLSIREFFMTHMSSRKNAVGLFALTFLSTAGLRETRKNEQQGQGGNYRNIVIFTKKNW